MSQEHGRLAPVRLRLGHTTDAIRLAAGRRDSRWLFGGVVLAYLSMYLWAVQDLSIRTDASPGITVVDAPIGTAMRRIGPASFERIALVDTGLFRLLFSPGNTLIGLTLAVLVGISLALTYLALVQPRACGLGASSGLFASIPALLGGTVCCGPIIALVLGIQLTSTAMTAFAWLLPVSVALLVGSTIYIGGKIQVETVAPQ